MLEGAFLAYRTLGHFSAARDNCVLIPSYYTGDDRSYDRIIGPGRAFDPDRYFIVLTNMFGNGVSASPSLLDNSCCGARFPQVSIYDNVIAQHRLLTERLGERLLGDGDAELFEYPLRQVYQPSADHAVNCQLRETARPRPRSKQPAICGVPARRECAPE